MSAGMMLFILTFRKLNLYLSLERYLSAWRLAMKEKTNQSEVTQLLHQIEREYIATQRGLTGLAEMAKHAFITARMEQMEKLHEEKR
jgi:hypothetical protein